MLEYEANLVNDAKVKNGQVHTKLEDGMIIFYKLAISNHTKLLYLKTNVNGKMLGRVLVDNGSVLNVIPPKTLVALGKTEVDIISTKLMVIVVTGEPARILLVIPLQITIESKTSVTTIFVINIIANYKLLLGRNLIHANTCVPFTLHLFLHFGMGTRSKW